MHIVVCLNQVLDPEIPARSFKIDPQARAPKLDGLSLVMGYFDENALEIALQLKEKLSEAHITALTFGGAQAKDMLRKALALRCDRAVLVQSPLHNPDSYQVAHALGRAIEKLGGADLVLAGRQGSDWDAGQVGSLVAVELGMPCVTFVAAMEPEGEELRLKRLLDGVQEMVRAQPPLAVTATNDERNQLRMPNVRDIMQASRKPLQEWSLEDLGLSAERLEEVRRLEIAELFIPQRESQAEMIEGESLDEKAAKLARRIREFI